MKCVTYSDTLCIVAVIQLIVREWPMETLYLIAVTPLLLAAGGAVAGWLITGRRVAVPTGSTRVLTVVVSSVALVVMIGYWLLRTIPSLVPACRTTQTSR